VAAFEAALRQETNIREGRIAASKAAEAFRDRAGNLHVTQSELEEKLQRLRHAESECEEAAQRQMKAKSNLDTALASRRAHRAFKPSMVDAVFSGGRAYHDWREKDLRLASAVTTSEDQRMEAGLTLEARETAKQELAGAAAQLSGEVERQRAELARHEEAVRALREQLGSSYPDPEDWVRSIEKRELSSPWADETWNCARTRVFLEALNVHRTFIECEPARIRNNLHDAIDLLTGKGAITDTRALQSAWATLFFVIPVVSTTFASFDRLFASLTRESLGWLLIDEAGQALPQAAAGAIWRSRRTLVVGDPLQLDPIVPLPFTAQQAMRKHFDVEDTWLPSRNSVQTLADRVNTLGTWLESENTDRAVWVGSPLRVHSRCEDPMFSISNAIAYSGQMVSATVEVPNPAESSCWLDAGTNDADDHWIPEQGLILKSLLADLFRCGIAPSSVLLLSPFRAVAR
jgi:AAA domain-containing protein